MKEVKIAIVLNTDGLEYDDRIRKEIQSIQRYRPDVIFKIYAIVPDNRNEVGITDYGVPYELISLKSREKYPSASHLVNKAFEFYRQVKPKLKDYDVVWCADCHVFFFPMLLPKKYNIIWDLHELPKPFMKRKIMRVLFNYLEGRCKLLFHANQSRIDYLKSMNMVKYPDRHLALRNFPDKTSLLSESVEETDTFLEFRNWLGTSDCVYIQGIYEKERRAYESMEAICKVKDLRAVVVGKVDQTAVALLKKKYGEELFNKKFFLTGMIPQKTTKLFIKLCKLSLIFYATSTPNNKFCEPNRLFQTVMLGLPVVVGCNPPMKEFVEKFNVGISINSDGDNIDEIHNAIIKILSNYKFFKSNIANNKGTILWENQDKIILDSLSKMITNN